MSITFGFHPLALTLALVLAGVLTWWVYRKTTPEISRGRRWVLSGLRFVALALVILLLAEPVIRSITTRQEKPIVAVLLDTSKSLSPTVSNTAEIRSQIGRLTSEISDALSSDVRLFTFGGDAQPPGGLIDSIAFDESRTDIAQALTQVREEFRGEPLASVVLVSDGLFNTGRNPVYVSERYPVPIHTFVVGDTTAHRDVLVQRIVANDVAYVNRELPIQVSLRSDGLGGRTVRVTLLGDGTELTSTSAALPDGRGEVPVDLRFTPEREGFQNYSIRIDPVEGELTESNNSANFSIRVLTRKMQVLLLAGAPSPDVATLSELLAEDRDIEVTTAIQKAPGEFYESEVPDDLAGFDAIILVGFPGRSSDPATVRRVADSGRPVLFVLGRDTNLRLVRDDLGGAIPAVLRTIRSGFVEASAVPTNAGRTHPAMNVDAGPTNLTRLPPLSYSQSLWEPTPDARTLATVAVRGIEIGDPLLVVRERAGVRSAALLGSGLWRWRNVPEDLEDLESLSPELVSNLLRWMTAEIDDRPVRVQPVQEFFDGGDEVRLTGQVYDESMNPAEGASVAVTVTDPGGNDFRYTMDPLGNGRFATDLGQLTEGTYRYTAIAEGQGASLGADSGYFAVGELTLEYRETRSDASLMRQIARRSGGTSALAADLDGFIGQLTAAGAAQPAEIQDVKDLPLRHIMPLLLVVLLLLTAEWVLRKRAGLV